MNIRSRRAEDVLTCETSRSSSSTYPWATLRARCGLPSATVTEITPLLRSSVTSVWAQVPAGVGRYERMGEPYAVRAGEHVVVHVPLHCAAGEVLGRVSFNADGSVGGLYLLPA